MKRFLLLIAALGCVGVGAMYVATLMGVDVASLGVTLPGAPLASSESPAKIAENAPQKSKGNGQGKGGITTVEVAQAKATRASQDIQAIGSLQSDEAVQLAPEITGRLSEIVFEEGRPVARGTVMVRLDDALAQAELAQAKARLTLATANNERTRALSRSGNASERSGDEAKAEFETATAQVELSQTRLGKHELRAPFDGIAGLRGVSVGAYVSAGTAIVNIEKIDILKVDFRVPEAFLQNIAVDQEVTLRVDAVQGRDFTARIYAINPLLDVNGRALQVRAKLINADNALRPGLFARIIVKGLTERDVVMIPEAAVVPQGGNSYVYKVEGGRATQQRVKLGERKGAEVEVIEGLGENAIVVVAGQQKLRDGAEVEVLQAPKPSGGVAAPNVGGNG